MCYKFVVVLPGLQLLPWEQVVSDSEFGVLSGANLLLIIKMTK